MVQRPARLTISLFMDNGEFSGKLTAMFPCAVLQEFAGEDTSDLFLEEREASLRQAQEEKHKIQMSVPGILNPHEIPEEMCD